MKKKKRVMPWWTKDWQEELMKLRTNLEDEKKIYCMWKLFNWNWLFYRNYIIWENLIKEKYWIDPQSYLDTKHKELHKKYQVAIISSEEINEA